MDAPHSSPSPADLDSRVIHGWAALEHGNIKEARAALQDVYLADPAHPALPLLAAGIRRARPRHIPWRGIVLLIGVLVAGAFAWRASSRLRTAPAAATGEVAAFPQEPAAGTALPNADPIGTAGRSAAARAPASASQSAHAAAPDDDSQIRQAISRFATAYSSKWTPLTFPFCDVSRSDDTATVTCRAHAAQGATDSAGEGAWLFACRKVGESWKIVRMQPPADLPPE
jgi:hypothetical protein